MQPIDFKEFFRLLQPFAVYGLDKETAEAFIEKGPKWCDFFEEVALRPLYESYVKSEMPFREFALYTVFHLWGSAVDMPEGSKRAELFDEILKA